MKKILKLWVPAFLWAAVIFLFSSFPTSKTSEIYWQDFIVKKSAHIVEYGIFAILLYRALKNSGVEKKNAGLIAILLAVIYGATDEYHQSFTPGREPRVRDIFFDTIGSVLAIYYLWNLLPKAPQRLKTWARRLQIN
ncbi:MAG: VanZ family protein [Patescibacteria group bacterium]